MRRAFPRGCQSAIAVFTLLWCVGCSATNLERPAPRQEPTSVALAGAPPVASEPTTRVDSARANTAPSRAPRFADEEIDWTANPVMRSLGRIDETLRDAVYTHGFRVDPKRGIYHFDCSGMVHYVLGKASPLAREASRQGLAGRPLARDYYHVIARSPTQASRAGWRKIERVVDVQPGDIVAWLKPKVLRKSTNTGHVAFAVLPPVAVPDSPGAFLLRVADASSLRHDDDTREQRDGFGMGTILLVTDAEGHPVEYGWVGLRWRTFETAIAIGRAD